MATGTEPEATSSTIRPYTGDEYLEYDKLHDPQYRDVLTTPTNTGGGSFTHPFFRTPRSVLVSVDKRTRMHRMLPDTSYAEHEAGDHTLYVGQVRAFRARPGHPLLFHSGQFTRVANEPVITSWGW